MLKINNLQSYQNNDWYFACLNLEKEKEKSFFYLCEIKGKLAKIGY